MHPHAFIDLELAQLKKDDCLRQLKVFDRLHGKYIYHGKKRLLNLASNDYLNLATQPALIRTIKKAVGQYGIGAGASRLISGTHRLHVQAEKVIAQWKKSEAALLFNSGYTANLGMIASLADRHTAILSDHLNHASIMDGILLSRAPFYRYRHCDCNHLEDLLKKIRYNFKRILIITDTVFSMDGDLAPLEEISALAEKYRALLLIDEAHATGILGQQGAGLSEALGLEKKIHLIMGTLSKAAGFLGAYVVASEKIKQFLINKARSFIFTTALPPAFAAGMIQSIRIIQQAGKERQALLLKAETLRQKLRAAGFNTGSSLTPIIPILLGDNQKVLQMQEKLFSTGLLVAAIRPPTVPPGTARLRLSLTAALTDSEIEWINHSIRKAA